MRRFLKDNRGTAGLLMRWQTWIIIGLAVLVVGLATGVIPNPFADKGDVHVDIGYILDDGTEIPIEPNATGSIFMDPITLRLYTDSSKSRSIKGVYGKLSVRPVTDMEVSTINVVWDGTAKSVLSTYVATEKIIAQKSGSADVSPNTTTQPSAATMLIYDTEFQSLSTSYSIAVWFDYNVTASAGGKTATNHATGNISCYWDSSTGTLTLEASVSTGIFEIR